MRPGIWLLAAHVFVRTSVLFLLDRVCFCLIGIECLYVAVDAIPQLDSVLDCTDRRIQGQLPGMGIDHQGRKHILGTRTMVATVYLDMSLKVVD